MSISSEKIRDLRRKSFKEIDDEIDLELKDNKGEHLNRTFQK
jgi:hypothetical protein